MSYVTHHPAVLEHALRWEDLNEAEQNAVIESVRTNSRDPIHAVFDVSLPCYFTIQFPVCRINPQAPADARGSLNILVDPRASSTDATPQSVETPQVTPASE